MDQKPLLELELRLVDAPPCASPGARVYALLPRLEELLARPGFGARDPILVRRMAPEAMWARIPRRLVH
jgi:hypothetical protein